MGRAHPALVLRRLLFAAACAISFIAPRDAASVEAPPAPAVPGARSDRNRTEVHGLGQGEDPLALAPDPINVALLGQDLPCCTSPQAVEVHGTVIDASTHNPVPGALIIGFSPSSQSYVSTAITDNAGHYSLGSIYGEYSVVSGVSGYLGQAIATTVGCFDCYGACGPAVVNFSLASSSCETWTSRAVIPTARSAATAVPVALGVYVLGGANAAGDLNTNEWFDVVGGAWSSLAPMTTSRAGFAAGLLGGYVYVTGGLNGATAAATTERYDPTNNTWAAPGTVPDMDHAGWGLCGVVLNGKFWVLGGYDETEHDMSWLRAYDPGTHLWSLMASMPTARSWHAAATLDGRIFAIGGTNASTAVALTSVDMYDPATNTWSAGPPLPQPLRDVSAVSDPANNCMLLIGGTSMNYWGPEIAYKVALQLRRAPTPTGYEWAYLNGYPDSGAGVAVALASGRLYGFGGRTESPATYSQQTWYLPQPTALVDISGVVRDPATGAHLASARVQVLDDVGLRASGVTNAQGAFSFHALPSGDRGLLVEIPNYAAVLNHYDFTCGTTTSVTLAPYADPVSRWTSLASLPTARSAASAVEVGGGIHILGGSNAGGALGTNERFNPATGAWTTRTTMPTPRSGFACNALLGQVFVAGGLTSGSGNAAVSTERYDPNTNAWTQVSAMPIPAWGVAGAVVSGLYGLWYISGGHSPDYGDVGVLRCYDPLEDHWTTLPMPRPRSWHASGTIDGKVFVIGGVNAASPAGLKSVDVFNPVSQTWAAGPDLPLPLRDLSAVSDEASHKIIVVGGTAGNGPGGQESCYSVVLELSASLNPSGYSWRFRGSYPTAAGGVAIALGENNYVYAFGGRTSSGSGYLQLSETLAPEALPDFVVGSITVAQSVSPPGLIRGKPTAITVKMINQGAPLSHATSVRAGITVKDGNGALLYTEAGPQLTWPAGNVASSDDFPDEARETGTNVFTFFLATSALDRSSLKISADVDAFNDVAESNDTNNDSASQPVTVTFEEPRRLRMGYCRILNKNHSGSRPSIDSGPELLAQTYPSVFNAATDWVRITDFVAAVGPGTPGFRPLLTLALNNKLRGINAGLDAAHKLHRLVAFVDDFGSDGGATWPTACASTTGQTTVLINADNDVHLGQAVAHEIAHTFGARGEYYTGGGAVWYADDWDDASNASWCPDNSPGQSVCNPIDNCPNRPAVHKSEGIVVGRYINPGDGGYNVRARHPAAYATDVWHTADGEAQSFVAPVTVAREGGHPVLHITSFASNVQTTASINFMGASDISDPYRWISRDVYDLLRNALPASSSAPIAKFVARLTTATPKISINLLIYPDDRVLPLAWWNWDTDDPVDSLVAGDYSIHMRDASGADIRTYPFSPVWQSDGSVAALGALLECPSGVARISIAHGGTTIYEREAGSTPLAVTLDSFNSAGPLDSVVAVHWSVTGCDPDSSWSRVEYSSDAGATWYPLAEDVRGTSLDWDTRLSPGTSAGLLRVTVSDGVRSTSATMAQSFVLSGKTPSVAILAPRDSAVVVAGAPVTLLASGHDAENGALAPGSFVWSSDLQGALGSVAELHIDSLAVGHHTLTVVTHDQDGNAAQSVAHLFVSADSDHDGMPDVWEALYPALAADFPDGQFDADGDSLSNLGEYVHGTNPINQDTDGDGFSDGFEVAHGSDPLSAASTPAAVESHIAPLKAAILHYPNPFHSSVAIRYSVAVQSPTSLAVYDVAGRLVTELASGVMTPGEYHLTWDGRSRSGTHVGAGVYFIQLRTDRQRIVSRAVVLR